MKNIVEIIRFVLNILFIPNLHQNHEDPWRRRICFIDCIFVHHALMQSLHESCMFIVMYFSITNHDVLIANRTEHRVVIFVKC